MIDFIIACICLVLAWQVILLRRVYFSKPVYEVRRQATSGNGFARLIYPVVAYGPTVRASLWLLLGVLTAAALVILAKLAPVWLGIGLVAVWLWLAFSWIPNRRVGALSRQSARVATPMLVWFLNWSYPFMRHLEKLSGRYWPEHTGIYESEDLHRLLIRTAVQPDNRLSEQELKGLQQLLSFKTAKTLQYSRSWKRTVKVYEDEAISPKLLDDLHKSGQAIFPVLYSKAVPRPTGWLYWEDIGLDSRGAVKDHKRTPVRYINEKETLDKALAKFSLSNASVFVVVNEQRKITGVLNLKDVLEALVSLDSKVNIADMEDIKTVAEAGQETVTKEQT